MEEMEELKILKCFGAIWTQATWLEACSPRHSKQEIETTHFGLGMVAIASSPRYSEPKADSMAV